MPSKDRISTRSNEWMAQEGISVPERLTATSSAARGARASRTERREMSAQVLRLASRLGSSADELAKKIPADTLRRTKYPVIEVVNEDGTRTFKHDPQIQEGPRALK